MIEVIQHWAQHHIGLIFVGALVLMSICIWLENVGRSNPAPRRDTMDYQLQQINNHLAQMRNHE